jgi:TRAP-type C4-dicarboxylate transport system permease small subunit
VSHFASAPALATALIVVQTGILVIGGLITYFSFKAYRRTGESSLRALTLGFGIITFGATIAGALDVILELNLVVGVLVDSVLTLIGFAIIMYSLYVE